MTDSSWMEKIVVSTFEQVEKYRSVLIICRTIKDLKTLEQNITLYRDMCSNKELVRIKIYQDESGSTVTQDEVDFSEIIIATNIAGRGTDLKTSTLL